MDTTNTPPTLKPHHVRAVKKALNILLADHADGYTESGGWAAGTQVRGWQVADECVELGLFELSLDSKKADLNSRRYRITIKGIELVVKIGDTIKFRNGTFATLMQIAREGYRFYVHYPDAGEEVTKWHDIGEFDLSYHTQEDPAPDIKNGAHIGILTAPDLGKSPYTRGEATPEEAAFVRAGLRGEDVVPPDAGIAIVEAVSADDDTEDRIETHYFMESIATSKDRTAAKLELERLLNEELYIVIHEQFIMVGNELHHVARLERESNSAAPQTIAQPVDDMLPELVQ